jgi:hypothetical protein
MIQPANGLCLVPPLTRMHSGRARWPIGPVLALARSARRDRYAGIQRVQFQLTGRIALLLAGG